MDNSDFINTGIINVDQDKVRVLLRDLNILKIDLEQKATELQRISKEIGDLIGNNMNVAKRAKIKSEFITNIVCKWYDITREDLSCKDRNREKVLPRQVWCWFQENFNDLSLKTIGEIINRDHSTVLHSKITINNAIVTDHTFKCDLEQMLICNGLYLLEDKIKSGEFIVKQKELL